MATTNYSFPEFTAEGTPDLIGVYNAAMVAIDKKLKELSDSIANTTNLDAVKSDVANLKSSVSTVNSTLGTVQSDVTNLKSSVSTVNSNISGINSSISSINSKITPATSDTSLTVAELNGAKLTAGGLVYYKKAQ
jgi:chromosome segregation ATPase